VSEAPCAICSLSIDWPSCGTTYAANRLSPRTIFADDDRRFADLVLIGETGFDFTQLDTESAHLDLMVHASHVFDRAVGTVAGQVAGAIEPRPRLS
jgi:hypothetical protein